MTWYYDGSVLYFYPAGEMTSEVIPLGSTSADQLQAALARLDVLDKRYPIAFDRRHNTARIAGPQRYVELVKETLQALERGNVSPGAPSEVRVFPLRYAWAADFTFLQGGREHRLPGVASVLRELYAPSAHGANNQTATATPAVASRLSNLGKMRGLYLNDAQVGALAGPAPSELTPTEDAAPHTSPGSGLPQFQPDGRMNAVIVRDRPERMASY